MSRAVGVIALTLVLGCGPGGAADETTDESADDGAALSQSCSDGCVYLLDCSPMGFASLYASMSQCESYCESTYGECVPEAQAYLECFIDLPCSEVETVLTSGPGATVCGPAFDALSVDCPP